jgi:hypothetical protein
LYDRTRQEISFEQVERIKIWANVARFLCPDVTAISRQLSAALPACAK